MRRLVATLMLVAVMALTVHAGAMAGVDDGPDADRPAAVHALPGHEVSASIDHGGLKHDHGKSPCKSACYGACCAMAVLSTSTTVELSARPVTRMIFVRIDALEGHDPGGLKRPPKSLLNA